MPGTITHTAHAGDARIKLVSAALTAALDGSPASGRPDLFAPNFRFIGPARDLFPEPGSERLRGQITDLTIDVREIESDDTRVVVHFNARARCHRVVATGAPVCADGVIVYHVASGRVSDAHGVLEWQDHEAIAS